MTRPFFHRAERPGAALLLAGLTLGGCTTDLGPCDDGLARTPYYTADGAGLPAYGGQALIERSCGGGSFCHSEAVTGAGRDGAPAGLDFDLQIASTPEQTERLRRGQHRVYELRHEILDLVRDGAMPPGEVGAEVVSLSQTYVGLPEIDTPEGEEILRNWLACGAPVVERVNARPADVQPVGDIVPAGGCAGTLCGGACVDTSTDPAHCGGCGSACGGGEVCHEGTCLSGGCPATTTDCSSACVDTATDPNNCGGCGIACGAGTGCVGGACVAGCGGGLTDCSGACVDTATDGRHCGGCGIACGSGQLCMGGSCEACGGGVTLSGDVQPILTGTCTGAMCHSGRLPRAGISLESGRTYGSLVGVPSSCMDGSLLVSPGLPAQSYLLNKLTGVAICGGRRMPLNGTPLSSSEIDLVRQWICGGALND